VSDAFDSVIIGDLVGTDRVLRDGYVAVRGDIIAAIGQGAPPPATHTLDHRGRLILPGLVDGHMHTSSAIGWAGIEGATRSARDMLSRLH
jgi:allantoinase